MTRDRLVELLEFKSHIIFEGHWKTIYEYNCEQYSVFWDTVTPRKGEVAVGKSYCDLMLISDGEIVYEGRNIDSLLDAITDVEKSNESFI